MAEVLQLSLYRPDTTALTLQQVADLGHGTLVRVTASRSVQVPAGTTLRFRGYERHPVEFGGVIAVAEEYAFDTLDGGECWLMDPRWRFEIAG